MSEIIRINGGTRLCGKIKIQGSKNTALPMIAAALLHDGITTIKNVPRITDVDIMIKIIENMGCICEYEDKTLKIDASHIMISDIDRSNVESLRSSVILIGALLGRLGSAVTYYPGGCLIGKRPIDYHLSGLKKMGAVITEDNKRVYAFTEKLHGEDIKLPFPSVGATENLILAAVKADGCTIINGAAMEPEIEELCSMLLEMGADISGVGTDTLCINGIDKLYDGSYSISGDRIVAGTYMAAVMAVGGNVDLEGIYPDYLWEVIRTFVKMGAKIETGANNINICMNERPCAVSVETGTYPGFPTDMQSQLLAVLTVSDGFSQVRENIFDGRFAVAPELIKLGANIDIRENIAFVKGEKKLRGADIIAKDLRGGAALVIAGLAAEGITRVDNCFYISRGYEDICRDLSSLGGKIIKEY